MDTDAARLIHLQLQVSAISVPNSAETWKGSDRPGGTAKFHMPVSLPLCPTIPSTTQRFPVSRKDQCPPHTVPRPLGTPGLHTVSPSQSEWILSQMVLLSCRCLGDQECLPQAAHPGSASHQVPNTPPTTTTQRSFCGGKSPDGEALEGRKGCAGSEGVPK